MFKLMIKTHSVTGLKYLCITRREKWEEYTGSGTYWKKHLKKHGKCFTTELLFQSEDYSEFVEQCVMYSEMFDVANNSEFANVIPESGYESKDRPNFVIFWETADESTKREIYTRRGKALKENHWVLSDSAQTIKDMISKAQISCWNNLSQEEKQIRIDRWRKGVELFMSDKLSEKYIAWTKSLSDSLKLMWETMSESERSRRSKSISEGRLNMSDHDKLIRGIRVSESFKTSERRRKFNSDMKTKRLGKNNPGAKIVLWFGVEYTKSDFNRLVKEHKFSKDYIDDQFNTRDDCVFPDSHNREYQILTCPHCGKKSEQNKQPSTFKRWHFDRCKERK